MADLNDFLKKDSVNFEKNISLNINSKNNQSSEDKLNIQKNQNQNFLSSEKRLTKEDIKKMIDADLNKAVKRISFNEHHKDDDVDIDKELEDVKFFFKDKVPLLKHIIDLLIKFEQSKKKEKVNEQIKVWNELLNYYIEFDIGADIASQKIRKISHELVYEAEVLHIKGDAFENIEEKSSLL